ncbi:MAG: hypothetical protein LBG95_07120 [Treponema sp.]|nr:hypothetical protein [Treponema sp.]
MKKSQLWAGITGFLLIAGLILTGCDDLFVFDPPGVPTGVTATVNPANNSIDITWNSASGAVSYDIYCAIGSSSSTKDRKANSANTSYRFTELPPETYYFFITARNSAGESGFSSHASATISKPYVPPSDAPVKQFWALDEYDEPYRITAALFAEGAKCNVWVENGSGVSMAAAQAVANEYDTAIYPKMISTYGVPLTYNGQNYSNPMDFADWMGDKDGKLIILILDIPYWAGYFFAVDLYPMPGYRSNECDIIYVDSDIDYTTIAHEMQHMMNFVTGVALRGINGYMDTWIDEGLSTAAEWVYQGRHTEWYVGWFNENGGVYGDGLIDKGNNFFVWGNRLTESQDAIYDDYATVYLFFQWLRLQTGGATAIYKSITSSNRADHRAVTAAMNAVFSGQGYDSWPTLLKTWLIANDLNDSTGPYGYGNDSLLRTVRVYNANANDGARLQLYPGEGVYSNVGASAISTDNNGPNIKNTYYTGSGQPSETFGAAYNNKYLVTYNANTDPKAAREYGRIGATSSVKPPNMRNIAEKRFSIAESSSGRSIRIGKSGLNSRIGRGTGGSSPDYWLEDL